MRLPAPFGPYLLLRRIGSGGMADIFLASAMGAAGFEKLICVKRIRSGRADDPEFVQLLVEEAKIVSHLQHPNVAQVFDLGRVQGQYYLAMEYVEGVDAFRLVSEAAERGMLLPVAAAVYIVRDLARGLAAAHEKTTLTGESLGIIHRDVSPHNVLVSVDGEVKIIDFGVAKAALRSTKTEAGVIKGKYNYLSPEQARGDALDPRSDVFSAGIVLYELLAGEPLYPGDSIPKLIDMARRARIPSLRKARKDVSPALRRICARALRRQRDKRFATARELADALDALLTSEHPGYGRHDLAELVGWLLPERSGGAFRPSDHMATGEFVSDPRLSIISVPSVAPAGPAAGPAANEVGALDAVPTRLASVREIQARRRARAAGAQLPPVPIGLTAHTRASPGPGRKGPALLWRGALVGLLVAAVGLLAAFLVTR